MNKNILNTICDISKETIKNKLINESYVVTIIHHGKQRTYDHYYYFDYSLLELYQSIFLNQYKLFCSLCVHLYYIYDDVKSILIKNNFTQQLYNIQSTESESNMYNTLIYYCKYKKEIFNKIYNEMIHIITELNVDDFRKIFPIESDSILIEQLSSLNFFIK